MRHSLEEYDRRLTSLTQDSISLAENMRTLASRLDEGDLAAPGWELVDELQFYRTRFFDLQSEICGPDGDASGEHRLKSLRDRLNQLREHESLLTELEQLDAWDSPQTSVLSRLQEVIDSAKSGSTADMRHTVQSLKQLRNLIDQSDLSDADWEGAREAVERNLGSEIAIAAVRGRLTFGVRVHSTPEVPGPPSGSELSTDSFHLD